ncbi:MAG: hypothetical protein LBP62_07540 [Clostridiales bacterium]|jgi:hypothetical protein|nr:hypothetical protein [Clostridiales bacterium]
MKDGGDFFEQWKRDYLDPKHPSHDIEYDEERRREQNEHNEWLREVFWDGDDEDEHPIDDDDDDDDDFDDDFDDDGDDDDDDDFDF